MSKIYPKDFEIKTEFTKIRELIKSQCLSHAGKAKVEEMSFLTDVNTIQYLLNLTFEFKHIVQFKDNFPVSYFIDTKSYFEKTQNIGTFFSANELFDIIRSLTTIKSIVNFFKNDEENNYTTLKRLSKEVSLFPFVISRISSILDKYGEIKNNASPELAKIRNDLSKKQSSVSQTIQRIFRKEIAAGNVEKDSEVTVRENKLLIPVEAKNKRKIKGIIYDESATGKTSYIEPIEVVTLNNEIRELEFAEKREIRKILTEITDELRPYFDDLKQSYDFMATIDFIRAKAIFAISINAEKPKLSNQNKIEFLNAVHPLLFIAYKNTNKKVIPSDFNLNEEQRILIISGPNAGGKSVSLKTVAILQYMLQCGLLIPVKSISVTGIFNNIFIDIGDEQSIENDLSTYSSHLKNMKVFTENSDKETLILIDEFGTGTEPMLGGAIAEAVLESIHKSNAKGIITTHYTNIKHFADNNEGIINAAMLYDNDNMRPLYKMEIGKPGSSFAFEIAEKTGLNQNILKNAQSKVDKNQIDFEKALKQTQSEKRKLKQSKRKIRITESKLTETLEKYEEELEKLLYKKKEVLKNAKAEAEEILNSANKKIEKTILEIKRKNAEKEQTKALRKELNEYIKTEKEKQRISDEKIHEKIEKIKQKKTKRNKMQNIVGEKMQKKEEIQQGDFVKITGTNTIAEVLSVKKNKAIVISNNIQLTVDKNKLELTTQKKQKSIKTSVKVIRTNEQNAEDFFDRLDIRGKRAEDALHTVSRYLDDAIVNQTRHLKILHGTGNGILREVIRDYLRSQDIVKDYKDERLEAGGSGITLIELDL
ncbi:MAG: Smr/MutS family protein [Bacteroidales bacterium]|nr:Smr/MutS family protein [Bacteroidales bacterium]